MLPGKKHIVFLHHSAVPGGAPTSLKNLVTGISRSNSYSLTILCARKEMMPFFELPGVEVEQYVKTSLSAGRWFIWGGFNWGLIKKTIYELFLAPLFIIREINFLKERNIALIHLNSSILWTSAFAAFLCGVPIVWHVRETLNGGKFNFRRLLYAKFVKRLAERVICIGPKEYDQLGGKYAGHVHCIYNSLDDTFFAEEKYRKRNIRNELSLSIDSFVYLSLGGASFRKGTFQLIESLKNLDKKFTLVIAGAFGRGGKRISVMDKLVLSCEDFLFRKGLTSCYSWRFDKRLAGALQSLDSRHFFHRELSTMCKHIYKHLMS
ncbi:MAG: hypothetical protein D3910_07915 [Candidatus Electrothrix sp. ATG2]|nr:hypothetical protein [Candidatus Electrothrix sp. ATG2]